MGRLPDQGLPRRGGLLEPCRDVHGVPCCQPLRGARDDLAGVHPDPAADPELRQRVPHLDRRPASPECIVLVRSRDPEHRHHCIADELLHRAAVRLDDRFHAFEVAREQCPQDFWIRLLSQRRRPRQVAEQHRHRLAGLASSLDRGERRPTAVAETRTGLVLLPAALTDEHRQRLGHRDTIRGSADITATTRDGGSDDLRRLDAALRRIVLPG